MYKPNLEGLGQAATIFETIYFRSSESVTANNMKEELIHVFQYFIYGKEYMDNCLKDPYTERSNIEYEAKLSVMIFDRICQNDLEAVATAFYSNDNGYQLSEVNDIIYYDYVYDTFNIDNFFSGLELFIKNNPAYNYPIDHNFYPQIIKK